MNGRTPAEAVHAFLQQQQRALSCVTSAIIHVTSGYNPRLQPLGADLSQEPALLRTRELTLGLVVSFQFRITEEAGLQNLWNIQTIGYQFALSDNSSREILAYHWHPLGVSAVTTPHLHLGPGALVGRDELRTAHLPTGAVALHDVIRLAIADFGVIPRRSDWAEVLQ